MKSVKKNGFTLMEILVVLGFFAIITWLFGGKVLNSFIKSDGQSENEIITMMVVGAKATKTTSGYTDANMIPSMIDMGQAAPQTVTITGTGAARKVLNQWGGEITFNGNQTDKTTFLVTDKNLPKATCIYMATSMSKGGLVDSTNINGKGARSGEVTAVQATADCDQDKTNTIAYIVQG